MALLTACLRLLTVIVVLSVLASGALLYLRYTPVGVTQCPRPDDTAASEARTEVARAVRESTKPYGWWWGVDHQAFPYFGGTDFFGKFFLRSRSNFLAQVLWGWGC